MSALFLPLVIVPAFSNKVLAFLCRNYNTTKIPASWWVLFYKEKYII